MGRNMAFSREARRYVKEQVLEMGEATVEEVANMIEPHYSFDPLAAKQREITNCARRLLMSLRSDDGTRIALAVNGQAGRYVNIDSCQNLQLLPQVKEQIDLKHRGLVLTRRKLKRRVAEIEGQQSLYGDQEELGNG